MRLQHGLLQNAAHLCPGNRLHDVPRQRLVAQFSDRPVLDGTPRQLRRLTRHRDNLCHLHRGEFRGSAWSRSVGQRIQNRLAQAMRFGAFPRAQRLPRIPPDSDLLAVEADLPGDLLVQKPLKPQQNDCRPLRGTLGNRARATEFLQHGLLLLADPNLRRLPWHGYSPASLSRFGERYGIFRFHETPFPRCRTSAALSFTGASGWCR